MKFLSSIRKSRKSKANDDGSVDDSSVYTSGIQSSSGANTVASLSSTHHTTISQQLNKQRRGVPASKKTAAAKVNKSSTNSISYANSEVSGLASVESYFKIFALPNQEKRFEGGPLLDRNNVPSKTNALPPDNSDPPPALTQINSMSSSSRSGLFSLNSLKSGNSFKSVDAPAAATGSASCAQDRSIRSAQDRSIRSAQDRSIRSAQDRSIRSVDAASKESGQPTPRMGCSRKSRMQVDDKSLSIPSDDSFRKTAPTIQNNRKRLLFRSCASTPQDLRFNLSVRDDGDSDNAGGPLPKLCALTATKLVFSDNGMLLCPPPASDKSTVLFNNRQLDADNDSLYDYNFPNADDDDDDDDSTIDVTLGSKINMTDEELMDERNASPGALRMTEEGLRNHTEMRREQTISTAKKKPSFSSSSSKAAGYDSWKRKQEQRKYYREKYEQRDQKLEEKMCVAKGRAVKASLPQSQQSRGKQQRASLNSAKGKSQSFRSPLVPCKKREEGVDDVSVAPMEMLNVDVMQQYASSSASRSSPFGSFCRKKPTPHHLLEAERAKQKQSDVKKEQAEKADFERIQKRREEYLKQHRELEAKAKEKRKRNPIAKEVISVDAPVAPMTEEASTRSFITNNSSKEDSRDNTSASIMSQSIMEEDMFTISTETSTQPCAVCLVGERTHIAMPCMHYSFCEDCVEAMECRGVSSCPVCKARRISFTKVFF